MGALAQPAMTVPPTQQMPRVEQPIPPQVSHPSEPSRGQPYGYPSSGQVQDYLAVCSLLHIESNTGSELKVKLQKECLKQEVIMNLDGYRKGRTKTDLAEASGSSPDHAGDDNLNGQQALEHGEIEGVESTQSRACFSEIRQWLVPNLVASKIPETREESKPTAGIALPRISISPSAADLGETLCSLNFASRVWGIESGPVRKQADLTEIFKDKQMAENLKHDEKETKKLQDNLQSLQLKLAAREHICRSVQEKETRAIAAACPKPPASSSLKQPLKTIAVKKPALGPSKPRMPLRRISNFLLPPSPIPPHKTMSSSSIHPASTDDKENMLRPTAAATNTKSFLQPRRTSIAVRLPPTSTAQVLQPKRRVSIAAFRPESKSRMTTPLNTQLKSRGAVGRQSFVRDPHRIRLISRIFAPLRRASGATVQATPTAMRSSSRFMGSSLQATPTSMRSSSKFMGSPSMEAGSLRSKYPAIIASAKETVSVEPTEDEGRHEKLQKITVLVPKNAESQTISGVKLSSLHQLLNSHGGIYPTEPCRKAVVLVTCPFGLSAARSSHHIIVQRENLWFQNPAGESLSARSTRGYLRTSLRCKQESLRKKVELNWDKMDENDVSMEIQETSLDHNQRLPVSQKIDELSTKTQTLKEHTILCNEVKSINADSSPGPEVYDALLFLGICRPLNQAEIANGSTSIVDFESSRENELQIICSDSSKKQFKFDHVFRPGSDQGCFCTNFTNCDFHAGWVQSLYILPMDKLELERPLQWKELQKIGESTTGLWRSCSEFQGREAR
uniref:Kinesin motor domain-containing protein n=1 Tax=Vitis vinifera TaxID=29760 RepID=A5BRH1_VITVI|nr:hypothetical protein VITISV_012392 [Vitis vinifera]